MTEQSQIRVLHLISDLRTGGGPYHILRHITAMDPSEFDHTLVSVRPVDTLAFEFRQAGIPVVFLEHRRALEVGRSIWRLVRLVRDRSIDIIHTNTRADRLVAHPAAALTSRPVVNTLRGPYSARFYARRQQGNDHGRTLRSLVEQLLYRRVVRQTIAVSDGLRGEWMRFAPASLSEMPIEVIYGGIDLEAFDGNRLTDETRLRKELRIEDGGPVLLQVSRLVHYKGHRFTIGMMPRVLASHPGAVLLLAGEGPLRGRLERMIEELGVSESVRLLGDRSDVPSLLAIADVFVLPSITEGSLYAEGFGVAALEAAAAGLPIVTFDLHPFDEYLSDGESGYVARPGDTRSLAEAVLCVLEDPDRARRMGKRNRALVEERLDVKIWAERLAEVYRRVANSRTPDS